MKHTDISDIQTAIVEAVQRIHDFCSTHNIRYYLIGGGLIGAIRHGGPIPWDDDIDIGMPRPDYEKFLTLSRSIGWPYIISTIETDPTYIYGFAKCYDTRTTATEELATPLTRGIWVDVFPIDGTFENPIARTIHISVTRSLKVMLASRCGAYAPEKQSRTISLLRKAAAAGSSFMSKSLLHSCLHRALSIKKYENSSQVGNLLGRWGAREISRKSVFNDQVEVAFSNRRFLIPTGYDEYLRGVYGNYMELPAIDKRKPDHLMSNISLRLSFLDPLKRNSRDSGE